MATLLERFDQKYVIDPMTGCWLWTAAVTGAGYGKIWRDGRLIGAHVVSFELHKGKVPEGQVVDHSCRVHACVNPHHLTLADKSENALRGLQGDLKTHCAKGHPWIPENIYTFQREDGRLRRTCLICARDRARRAQAKKRKK